VRRWGGKPNSPNIVKRHAPMHPIEPVTIYDSCGAVIRVITPPRPQYTKPNARRSGRNEAINRGLFSGPKP
jgi:hypothetical protein